MRRCTNEAVRSARIRIVRWPYPAGGAQCVLSHVGGGARCVLPHPGMGVKYGWSEFVPSSDAGSTQPPPRGKNIVPEHVNQYVSGTRLPATAWPRQTRPASGRGWWHSGWWYSGWWYRLGCRASSFPIKGPPMYPRVWSPGAGTPGRRDSQRSYLQG